MTVLIRCLISSALMILMTKAPVALAQAKAKAGKGYDNRNPRLLALVVDEIGNPHNWDSAFD